MKMLHELHSKIFSYIFGKQNSLYSTTNNQRFETIFLCLPRNFNNESPSQLKLTSYSGDKNSIIKPES